MTINPYESRSVPINSGMPGSEDVSPATLHQLAASWLSLSGGCVLGAYTAVAMTDGLASAFSRGIPPMHLFAPVFAIAIASTGIWRWFRFRGSGSYALEPISKFISGAFAACSTFLVMTLLDAAHLVDPFLPLLHLPLFVITCVIAVEVEGALRQAFRSRGLTNESLTSRRW